METTVLREAARTESNYVTQPTEGTRRAWLSVQDMALQVSLTKAENKCFFQKQTLFEEGEGTGHMLAIMAKANRCSSFIPALTKPTGELT